MTAIEHNHDTLLIPPELEDPDGRPVDHELLGRLLGACFDTCTACADPLMDRCVADVATCARLVELACLSVAEVIGGVPAILTNKDAPGPASPEFRELADAGAEGNNKAMWQLCGQMIPEQRRAALDTALNLLTASIRLASEG